MRKDVVDIYNITCIHTYIYSFRLGMMN